MLIFFPFLFLAAKESADTLEAKVLLMVGLDLNKCDGETSLLEVRLCLKKSGVAIDAILKTVCYTVLFGEAAVKLCGGVVRI